MSQADEHLLRIDNWAGTHGSCALEVYHPKTQDKVKAIISKERDLGHKLKAMGAGHSPNDIFCLQDKQGSSIDVRDMSELWGISKENMTVTVGAGMLLSTRY
jgi:FAD/FMN-containing dehydrogenase